MLEQIEAYYKIEYQDAKRVVENKVCWAKPREVVDNTLQRMLGVAFFTQQINPELSYTDIENLYNLYKEKLKIY